MNQAVAEKSLRPEVIVPSALRRFEIPDMDRHPWIVERLKKGYAHLNDAQIVGWLRGIIYQPDFHFVFQPNACGLAQVTREHTLAPISILTERFVWARDPTDKQHVAEAAQIYAEFRKTAKDRCLEVVIVAEASDVPEEMIAEVLKGRLFERKQKYVKVA